MTAIRLLLVDDDPLVRAGLSLMLGGAGDIEIVGEAADGSEVGAEVTYEADPLCGARWHVWDRTSPLRRLARSW
ncbi:hypothetical protein ABZ590_32885, partial [Streptomyces hirsutus]|uniref:response regulator transcription factor n=1 Tax=Streptomyces hirsutus TaxID=35620 RepID=UPI00349A47B0